MSNTSHSAYIEDTKALVKSIVIKSSLIAFRVNEELQLQGYDVDLENPESWKYYLNLAGLPHESDAEITITSLDTMDEIPFTHDVLSQHRATLSEYTKRTEYYNALIQQYPQSEAYINGVLNPVNMRTAITSEEHNILTYNKDLLESQETQLIPALQERIVDFFDVYTVEGYTYRHELYIPVLMAAAYTNIFQNVLALRLAACHTPNAHSFHIWAYLSGFFNLDDFKTVLTIDQALYLYRNIRAISNTTYSTQTFDDLIEVFLTARSIPLYAYNLNHNVSDIDETGEITVEHEKLLLNFSSGLDRADQRESVRQLLLDSVSSADRNAETIDIDEREVKDTVSQGVTGRYLTKVLEADITDTSLTQGIALIELIYTEWLRLSADGRYRLRTTVPNPSGGGAVTLSAKEAFVLLIYLSYRSLDMDVEEIPELTDFACLRDSVPTLAQLKQGELAIDGLDDDIQLMREFPYAGTIISAISFRRYVEDLKTHLLRCKQMAYDQSNMHSAISLDSIYEKFFYPRTYKLADVTRFEDWLSKRGLDLYGVSPEIADNLSGAILEKFTGGSDYDGSKLYRAHVAILNLVERLTHHDLQFIRNSTDRPALSAMAKSVRIGTPMFYANGLAIITGMQPDYRTETIETYYKEELYGHSAIVEVETNTSSNIDLLTSPSISATIEIESRFDYNIGNASYDITITPN